MTLSVSEYEELFKSNHKKLCNTAYRITHDKDSAKDIVQNVFLKLWDKRNEINIGTSIEGYLYKSTSNASINYLETNKRHLSYVKEIKFTASASEETASKNITLKELESLIEQSLLTLPPKCRAIFILNRYDGMRYKQIAEHLDISVNTVENQMVKALSIMREELKPYLTKEFLIISISAGISALLQFLSLMIVIMLFKSIL
ncbi:MAG: RNA polymerase sigma-70 factor [Bacteroidota bacterium]|nr:RNA polymerase sigma-70 factor [Bacteroidota bacterium]MDP3144540.1 RNA polymerase sigma-70 factor [Bacteroidota bacterium]MDP3555783.1 RNA polymerase sigma-70 factor [Bacteroidota bacterium]